MNNYFEDKLVRGLQVIVNALTEAMLEIADFRLEIEPDGDLIIVGVFRDNFDMRHLSAVQRSLSEINNAKEEIAKRLAYQLQVILWGHEDSELRASELEDYRTRAFSGTDSRRAMIGESHRTAGK